MHTFSESGAGVPAFLAKLWRLVEDPETNDLISWSTDGRSFIIQNQAQFAKELLPLNYKHNNMASFIRQLNMYGFHKITSIDNGGLRFDKDEMEFTHPCFQKDHPYLLEHIKRKIATSKQQHEDKSGLKLEAVNRVLTEMKQMRGRQDSLDNRFATMKQENEALWREVAILRQKHLKQQQIVNKLIQFLVTIVQPSRGGLSSMGNGNNKRRFQLMINDAPQSKLKKTEGNEGASIQELGEALEEVAYENEQELMTSDVPEVTSPVSMAHQSPYRPGSVNEIIEEAGSPTPRLRKGTTTVKKEKPDLADSATRDIVQLIDTGDEETHESDYDSEGYLVDHVDEIDANDLPIYNETDMLNTPMVIEEMQKQEELKQQQEELLQQQLRQELLQQQQQIRQQQMLQLKATRGESLLKAKKSGTVNKTQKSLLSSNEKKNDTAKGNNNIETNMLPKKNRNIPTANKQLPSTPDNTVSNAGPSGTNNTTTEPVGYRYQVDDFIVNVIPNDIFDDNSQAEKESPMLGAFNFEGGFYNPNLNINEMKSRQQSLQQTQQEAQNQQTDQTFDQTQEKQSEATDADNSQALSRFVSNDNDLNKLQTIVEYGQHIDSIQTDLDSLKDLLKGEGYHLDANTLLGLFNGNEDLIGYDFPMSLPDAEENQKRNTNGGALTNTTEGDTNLIDQISPNSVPSSTNQLMTYKTTPVTTATGDFIDLNELLCTENNNEEDNPSLV